MGRKRRQFSNQFKFTVALEAVKGLKNVNQIAGDGCEPIRAVPSDPETARFHHTLSGTVF